MPPPYWFAQAAGGPADSTEEEVLEANSPARHDYNSSDYSNGSSADSDGDADAKMLDSLDGGVNEP